MGLPMVWAPDALAAACFSPQGVAMLGALHGEASILIDLRQDTAPLEAINQLPAAVLIGIGGPHTMCDVVVEDEPTARALAAAVDATPMAAVVLVQLLRLQASLDPYAALVAESLAYAALQGGAEFAAWLNARGSRIRKADDRPRVQITRRGASAVVTLDRPRLFNLYDAAMRDALVASLGALRDDPEIETIALRGAGKAFCAGGDLAEFGTTRDTTVAHLIRSSANVAPMLLDLSPKLTAHVHGAAIGAGCEIAAFASHVTATVDATFALPEVTMGLVPGAGGTVSVTRRIGRQRTAWLALSGARIDAPTAQSWGLVDTLTNH